MAKIEAQQLQGVFGMYEKRVAVSMEAAAAEIASRYHVNGQWLSFSVLDFATKDSLIGFSELLYHGWLIKVDPFYNGVFSVNRKFVERVSPYLNKE